MNIAIDIDGVITDLETFIDQEGEKYYGYKAIDKSGYDLDTRFKVSREECDAFWDKIFYKYITTISTRPNAKEITHKLHEEGNKIFIITSRKFFPQYGWKTKEEMTASTLKFLSINDIYYDKYIETDDPKVKATLENKIDVFIEDSPKNIKELSKVTNVIIFESSYNKDLDCSEYHAKDWNEVYATIKNLENN